MARNELQLQMETEYFRLELFGIKTVLEEASSLKKKKKEKKKKERKEKKNRKRERKKDNSAYPSKSDLT